MALATTKTDLGTLIPLTDSLQQSAFDLRDIHFQNGTLVVYTMQGNVIPLPASDFAAFTDAVRGAVKAYILSPPVPTSDPKIK